MKSGQRNVRFKSSLWTFKNQYLLGNYYICDIIDSTKKYFKPNGGREKRNILMKQLLTDFHENKKKRKFYFHYN